MLRSILGAAVALSTASIALAQQPGPDHLVAGFVVEGQSIDATKYIASSDIHTVGQIFEQLIRPDADGNMVNWLAEEWQVVDAGEQPIVEVLLREGVKFHNGYTLTSSDFEFAYQRMSDPNISRWSHLHAAIDRFEVLDDRRFRLHFKFGDASYLSQNLTLYAVSKQYFDEVGEETFTNHPIGTGPWKFVSRKIGEEVQLEAFDDYWNDEYRAQFSKFTIRVIPEAATRISALKTGEVHIIDSVPPHEAVALASDPAFSVASNNSNQKLFLLMNEHQEDSPFRDIRVREAVAHAIDMPAIIQSVLFGQGDTYAVQADGEIGYDPGLQPRLYDPEKASALLSEAGYPNGFDIPCYSPLALPSAPNVKNASDAIFAYLGAIGIRCEVGNLEYAAWLNMARREGTPDLDGILVMAWGYTSVPADPHRDWMGRMHSFASGTGFGAFSYANDPEIDELVKVQGQLMDINERKESLKSTAGIIHDRIVGGVPLYLPKTNLAWSNSINFTPLPWSWHEMLSVSPAQ